MIDAVEVPDRVALQSVNRYRIVKAIYNNQKKFLLIVVYDQMGERIEVVTAFLTTKFKKHL